MIFQSTNYAQNIIFYAPQLPNFLQKTIIGRVVFVRKTLIKNDNVSQLADRAKIRVQS